MSTTFTYVRVCRCIVISISDPGAPGEPFLDSFTHDSLTFHWAIPDKPNGLIREYRINYEYFEQICHGYGKKISASETLYYFTESDFIPNNASLYNLNASWYYNISIEARTSKGYGSNSTLGSFITAESSMC